MHLEEWLLDSRAFLLNIAWVDRSRLAAKSQRVKTQRVNISENFAEEEMFAEDISEDLSEDRNITFTGF